MDDCIFEIEPEEPITAANIYENRWVTATNCIKFLCGNNDFKKLIKDKETRVSLFKTLRDNYGDIV